MITEIRNGGAGSTAKPGDFSGPTGEPARGDDLRASHPGHRASQAHDDPGLREERLTVTLHSPPPGCSARRGPIAALGAKLPREQFIVHAEPAFLLFGVGVLEGQQALDEDRFPEPPVALSGPRQIA